jgi:hypothetical protein
MIAISTSVSTLTYENERDKGKTCLQFLTFAINEISIANQTINMKPAERSSLMCAMFLGSSLWLQ